jgi:uncharacterized membrane protein
VARIGFSNNLAARADQAGLLAAAINAPTTFQRTLMPRPLADQAIVTGLSVASNHALVALLQEVIQATAFVVARPGRRATDDARWGRIALALDAAAIAAGLAVQRAFAQQHREPLRRAALRTGGYWLSVTGVTGAVVGGLQEAARGPSRGRRRTLPAVLPAAAVLAGANVVRVHRAAAADSGMPSQATASALKSVAYGTAVAAGTSAFALTERTLASAIARSVARVLPGRREVWQPLGHAATLAAFGALARLLVERAFAGIETKETAVESAFDVAPPNPLVSGSRASLVPFHTLSRQGGRFVWTVTTQQQIEKILDEPAVAMPIRVYAGLASASDEQARVDLLLAELDRTGAFDRSWLLVASPTGTGYVNYAAASAFELLARGDCATVAMQYAARPSFLSLDRVKEGRRQMRLLIRALGERLAALPPDRRPTVVLFGESLGAWTSQDPFVGRGTAGMEAAGIDRAVWIGTPHFSKWKEEVLFDDSDDIDTSRIGVFPDIEAWRALDPSVREHIRYVMITHHDDGVALFGPELAIQAPEWLARDRATRPPGVPKSMRWVPMSTFFQVLVDMKNSATVVPGQFDAKGHDYRADLLPFLHETLGFEASPEQLERIHAWLEQQELRRTEWIEAHSVTGRSLAAAIVDRAARQLEAEGLDPDDRLLRIVQQVAEEEFAAGGGAVTSTAPNPSM